MRAAGAAGAADPRPEASSFKRGRRRPGEKNVFKKSASGGAAGAKKAGFLPTLKKRGRRRARRGLYP